MLQSALHWLLVEENEMREIGSYGLHGPQTPKHDVKMIHVLGNTDIRKGPFDTISLCLVWSNYKKQT